MSQAEWCCAVAAAAANELNDELTIILTAVQNTLRSLPETANERIALLELRAAARRSATTTSALLEFTGRRGTRASAASMHALMRDA
jgi:hypothetical protein